MKILILISMLFFSLAEAKSLKIVSAEDIEEKGIALTKKTKGNAYIMRDCPVIGNTESMIYHVPGQPHYQRMLVKNKCVDQKKCKDNRRCFDTEAEAIEMSYRRANTQGDM